MRQSETPAIQRQGLQQKKAEPQRAPGLAGMGDARPQLQQQQAIQSMANSGPRAVQFKQKMASIVGGQFDARHSPASANAPVAQLVPMAKRVNGLTHLVRLHEGSLYQRDFLVNEVMEVSGHDAIVIESDLGYLSRRGPNQEVRENNQDDELGEQKHSWVKVLSVNGATAGQEVYVREATLLDDDQLDGEPPTLAPYDFLMNNLGRIKPSMPEDGPVVSRLIELKSAYDEQRNREKKLRIADQMSSIAAHLASPELSEVRRTIAKYPHVILHPDETVSLDEMGAIIGAIDKSRELGLINLEQDRGPGQMGLFLGPSQSSIAGAGASVGTPGRSTTGFGQSNASFIAHTHPRETSSQKPHDKELQTDVESAKGMEMVRPTTGETFFYNQDGPKNETHAGNHDLEFTDKLKAPNLTDLINGNIRLTPPGGQKFKDQAPTGSEVESAREQAHAEADAMWARVEEIAAILRTGSLKQAQYVALLKEMNILVARLEDRRLLVVERWKARFPTEDLPKDNDEFDPWSMMKF